MKTITKLWIGLAILIVLSPLGLLLPEYFKAGEAWGEWSGEKVKELVGYIPQGLEKLSSLWIAPLPDYTLKGSEGKGLLQISFTYIISAVIGVMIIISIMFIIGKILSRKR